MGRRCRFRGPLVFMSTDLVIWPIPFIWPYMRCNLSGVLRTYVVCLTAKRGNKIQNCCVISVVICLYCNVAKLVVFLVVESTCGCSGSVGLSPAFLKICDCELGICFVLKGLDVRVFLVTL
jgi:hypothetical protein